MSDERVEGRVAAIRGAVVDLAFERGPPPIEDAVEILDADGRVVVAEIQAHLDAHSARAIALEPTNGLRRGDAARAAGEVRWAVCRQQAGHGGRRRRAPHRLVSGRSSARARWRARGGRRDGPGFRRRRRARPRRGFRPRPRSAAARARTRGRPRRREWRRPSLDPLVAHRMRSCVGATIAPSLDPGATTRKATSGRGDGRATPTTRRGSEPTGSCAGNRWRLSLRDGRTAGYVADAIARPADAVIHWQPSLPRFAEQHRG